MPGLLYSHIRYWIFFYNYWRSDILGCIARIFFGGRGGRLNLYNLTAWHA